MFLLLEISDENVYQAKEETDLEANEQVENKSMQNMAEISFHAILDKIEGATMKVQGSLENKVLILVDSGSIHNSITTPLVKK